MLDLKDLKSQAHFLGQAVSEDSFEKLSLKNFPTKKMEDWRYTNLKFLDSPLKLADSVSEKLCKPYFKNSIQVVNGYQSEVCDLLQSTDLGFEEKESYFDDLNRTFCPEQKSYVISEKVKELSLNQHFISGESDKMSLSNPCINLSIDPGVTVQIYEKWFTDLKSSLAANVALNIKVQKGAHLTLIRDIRAKDPLFYGISSLNIDLHEQAQIHVYDILEGSFLRKEIQVNVKGRGAKAYLSGMTLTKDKNFVELRANVVHEVCDGFSKQNFKSLALDNSKVVFQAGVDIRKDAQKVDSAQMYRGLSLSKSAQIFAKPQLKVQADDVKAAHGFATQSLDEESLFYMLSRGLDMANCRKLFLDGFCQSVYQDLLESPLYETQIKPGLLEFVKEGADA